MGVTSIRLNSDIETPLEDLAKKLDRSKNYLINQAIKDYLARQSMEEVRWIDTQAALNSVNSGKSISEEKVKTWLESWGSKVEVEPPKI
ncbi:MAG: CopG family transcriptional regulator [marine bacterium B5-7]|nr:MAG: CopG family transcriptional regulator [marine bacterium B5-7]